MTVPQMPKCIGVLGFIFGHKFSGGGYVGWNNCLRCGISKNNCTQKDDKRMK